MIVVKLVSSLYQNKNKQYFCTFLHRFVCTAYYQHGTQRDFLHSHPRTIQDSHVHAIATQVSAGMAYLHAMSIVHGLVETTSVLIGGHVEVRTKSALSLLSSIICLVFFSVFLTYLIYVISL